MMWNFCVDDSDEGRYETILGRYIFTDLWLNLKWSDNIIEAYYGPLKGSTTPMVDLDTYESKDLNTGNITLKELFKNAYVYEIHELEQVRTSNKQLHVILDAK